MFTPAKAESPRSRSSRSFGSALLLHHRRGRLAVPANPLVQILAIAAGGDGRHQNVLGRHERQFFGQVPGDHLRINHQAAATFSYRIRIASTASKACGSVSRRLALSSSVRSSHCVAAVSAALDSRLMTNRARPQIRSARIGLRL